MSKNSNDIFATLPTSYHYSKTKSSKNRHTNSNKKRTQKKTPNTIYDDTDDVDNSPILLELVPKMSFITQNGNTPYYHNVGETDAGISYDFPRYILYNGKDLPGAIRKHNAGIKTVARTDDDDHNSGSDSDDYSGKTTDDGSDSDSDMYSRYSETYENYDDDDKILKKLIEEDNDDQYLDELMKQPDNEPDNVSAPIDEDYINNYLSNKHSPWLGGKQTRRRSVYGKRTTRSNVPISRRVTRSSSKKRPTKNTRRRRSYRQRK